MIKADSKPCTLPLTAVWHLTLGRTSKVTPPPWPPSWILPKIKNYQQQQKLEIVNASHVKYDIVKHFTAFCMQFLLFSPKKGEKTHSFTQKWLDHLLLMTSYLVTAATDSQQTCVKMCLRDMPTATENGRC